jgi:His/Glu/Gln/Arg/opine family amino acid ABC transporter permease subunit
VPFDPNMMRRALPILLEGLRVTIELSLLAVVLAALWGIPVVAARLSPQRSLWIPAVSYIQLVRNTPVLVQMYFFYFGFAMAGLRLSGFTAGLLALVLQNAGYIAEIYRAGIAAVGDRQREAGLALGMRPHRVFLKVVLPQATKIAIPNLGSMLIGMLKDTSTFSFIGASEIIFHVQNLEQTYYQPFPLYTAAAAVYVFAAFVIDYLFRNIELALTVPPSRGVAGIWGRRRSRQITAIAERVQAADAGA